MKLLLKLIRFPLLLAHVILGLTLILIFFNPLIRPVVAKKILHKIVTTWSYGLCRVCGLTIRCYGERTPTAALFVANHISWLDIFALLGTFYVTFVSKQEVQNWFILGYLSTGVGTLYMRRGQGEAMTLASQDMRKLLESGECVLLFPEGTTTNGAQVKRFHARMFQAALDAQIPIQPIALRYPNPDGSLNKTTPYIDDDTFPAHVWRLLGEWSHTIEIHYCPPLPVDGKKRRELADYAQQQIVDCLANRG